MKALHLIYQLHNWLACPKTLNPFFLHFTLPVVTALYLHNINSPTSYNTDKMFFYVVFQKHKSVLLVWLDAT